MSSELMNFPRKLDALGLVLDALPPSVSEKQKEEMAERFIDESLVKMEREVAQMEQENREALWEMMQPPAYLNIP